MEKRALALRELDAQTALQLPDRETLALINVIVVDVIDVEDVDVAANVCPNLGLLAVQENVTIDCDAEA